MAMKNGKIDVNTEEEFYCKDLNDELHVSCVLLYFCKLFYITRSPSSIMACIVHEGHMTYLYMYAIWKAHACLMQM